MAAWSKDIAKITRVIRLVQVKSGQMGAMVYSVATVYTWAILAQLHKGTQSLSNWMEVISMEGGWMMGMGRKYEEGGENLSSSWYSMSWLKSPQIQTDKSKLFLSFLTEPSLLSLFLIFNLSYHHCHYPALSRFVVILIFNSYPTPKRLYIQYRNTLKCFSLAS